MDAEHEVECVEHVVGGDDVRECLVEVVLLNSEALDVPAGAPDIGRVGDTEGRVGGLLLLECGEVAADGFAEIVKEGFVVE